MPRKVQLSSQFLSSIPQHGVFDGGPLKGWTFGVLEIVVEAGEVMAHVNACQPFWPFPQLVELTLADCEHLAVGPGPAPRFLNLASVLEAERQRLEDASRGVKNKKAPRARRK